MDNITRFFLKLYIFKAASRLDQEVTKISETVIDILADAVIYRLSTIAKETKLLAEQNSRASPNGLDVFHVLQRYREDYNTLYSFILESISIDLETPLPYPINPKDIKYFNREVAESFPFRVEAPLAMAFSEDSPPLPHIPPYFPQPFQEDPLRTQQCVADLEKAKRSAEANQAILEEMEKNPLIIRPAQTTPSFDSPLSEDIISSLLNH